MPQRNQAGEFNTFVGGLVTEASPLTFPENASIDEANFTLNQDGSRTRRLGMDLEAGLTPASVTYSIPPAGSLAIATYQWTDVAGISGKSFTVCQIQDKAYILDKADPTLATNGYVKHTFDLCTTCLNPAQASFVSIDGLLVVAYNDPTIKIVTYDQDSDSFEEESRPLQTRDLFGVEDKFVVDGVEQDLLSPEWINYRPYSVDSEDAHMYNLRNQGWGLPYLRWANDYKADAVLRFIARGGTPAALPSNADTPVANIYPNPFRDDKSSERFHSSGSVKVEPTKTRATTGHIVIDALSRGTSREESIRRITDTANGLYANANSREPIKFVEFRTPTVSLPEDRTEGGATAIAEFAGRVFYGGFSNKIVGGDSQSPALASYVFYSQLVNDISQVTRCFQAGDPTGVEEPDLLDTDGGFVRIAGAHNIQRLVSIGRALVVVAENGVWSIGGSDSGIFTANNLSINKITEHGTISPESVVLVDGTIMYWSDDAIYHLTSNEYGDLIANELTLNIRKYYQDIDSTEKLTCQGVFDSYSKKVRWLYNNRPLSSGAPTELVFDLVLAAFYPSVIGTLGASGPLPVAPIIVNPYRPVDTDVGVLVGEDNVLSDVDEVNVTATVKTGGFRETAYLTLLNADDPALTEFSLSSYLDEGFSDWRSVDGTGVDAPAFLLTGYLGVEDAHRFKQVPYIYFHFIRTEDGFVEVGDDLVPLNQSSCLVQSQWDWANSASYGKWGKEFQAYRYRRNYIANNSLDGFDYGTRTVVSRSKLRGRGRVVSLKISSEAGKDLQLLGWSMMIGVNDNG